MIDISSEQLIPIREVPRLLPLRRTGRRVHISAVYRWIKRGIRGVCLETVKIGGSTYTSTEALQRFTDHLSGEAADKAEPVVSCRLSRQRQIEQAARRVESLLRGDDQVRR